MLLATAESETMQSVTRAVLTDERNGGGKGERDAYGKSEQKVRFRMLLLGLGIRAF